MTKAKVQLFAFLSLFLLLSEGICEEPYEFKFGKYAINNLDAESAQTIQAQDGYENRTFTFGKDATDEDLKTITLLPKIKKLSLDQAKVHDLTPLKSLVNLTDLNCYMLTPLNSEKRVDLQVLGDLRQLKKLSLYGTRGNSTTSLGSLNQLEELNLYMADVPNIEFLKGMPSLRKLNLYSNPRVTSLEPLIHTPQLEELDLYMSKAPEPEFEHLKALTKMKKLGLGFCPVSSLGFLSGMDDLEVLNANWCRNLKDINAIAELKKLRELELMDAACTGFSAIEGLTNLQRLNLKGTSFQDTQILTSLQNLRTLNIGNTPVETLAPLHQLKNLKRLTVPKTISSDQIDALKKELPELTVNQQ